MSNLFNLLIKNGLYINTFLLVFIIFWLILLSVYCFKQKRYSQKLFGGTTGEELKKILENHLSRVAKVSGRLDEHEAVLKKIQDENQRHLQKIGFIRYNPFQETGGDQSFVVALLDQRDNGVIISSLHGRNQTRVFAKTVTEGKSEKYSFSAEEEKAVEKAKSTKD